MRVDLHHILAGVGTRAVHGDEQHLAGVARTDIH
jgi:hypothetical protein